MMRVLSASRRLGQICIHEPSNWVWTRILPPQHRRYAAPAARSKIVLRPYQEESIQAVLDYAQRGHRRLGISLATGAGKTVIFSQLIGRIQSAEPRATRTLILVHRRELVEQAFRHCRDAYPNLEVDIEMGNMHASGQADITVASVLSLARGRLDKYDPATFKLILVDEAHHMVSPSYLQILDHFGLVSPRNSGDTSLKDEATEPQPTATDPTPLLVGVSATLARFDGLSLGHAIDHIVYHKDYVDLIGEKWLSDVRFTTAKSRADLSRVKSVTDGDFITSSLSHAMNTDDVNEAVVQTWLHKAKGRKSTLVFGVDVAHVEGLQRKFRGYGVDARSVTGSTPIYQRSANVDAFRNGEFPVLINCAVFTEGTDIPNIDCVLLARPTKSRNLLVQMIGRGMRLFDGKENCHVIDMVSALKVGIVCVPTLFGLDPTTLLDEEGISDLNKRADHMTPMTNGTERNGLESDGDLSHGGKMAGERRIEYTEYDSIIDLLTDEQRDLHVRQLSKNNWLHIGPDKDGCGRYILAGNDAYLRLTDRSARRPRFEVAIVSKIPQLLQQGLIDAEKKWVPWGRAKVIAYGEDFASAVRAGDTFVAEGATAASLFPRRIVEWNQVWRKQPITEKQITMIKKRQVLDNATDCSKMTKGQGIDMITRLSHGASTHFGALKTRQKRAAREAEAVKRMQALQTRGSVQVGPVA